MLVVARVQGDAFTRHLNVPRRHHVGGRQAHLLPRTQAHRAPGAAQRAHALALRHPRRVQRLAQRRAAYREPEAAAAEYPALFAAHLFKLPVRLGARRGGEVTPRRQRQVAVRRHRRARHPDVPSRQQRHTARRQQRPLLGALLGVAHRVRHGLREGLLLHRGFFKKVMLTFRCRQQAQVAPRQRRQRPARLQRRALHPDVLTGLQTQPRARRQRRALLRLRLLPVQMPVPRILAELRFAARQQAQVTPCRQRHRPAGGQRRRRGADILPGLQAQAAAAGQLALQQPLLAALVRVAALHVHRPALGGQRRQPEVTPRRQRHRPAGGQLCARQLQVAPGLQRQPVARLNQPRLPHVGTQQRPGAAPVLRRRLPGVQRGAVEDVPGDARQRHLPARHRRAGVGQVAERHHVQAAVRRQQPALPVAHRAAAVQRQLFAALHRAAPVVDVAARRQADAVRHDAAALQVAFIRLRQIEFRGQHRLPAHADRLPPQDAVAQPRHLRRAQAHPQLQVQRRFRRRRVVHQPLHLRQLRAEPPQVALPGLAQYRIADVARVKRRIAEKTVVVLRIQVQLAQQVG